MKEKPTTFQLAQLAAQASPPHTRARDAVRRALELWSEAEVSISEFENRAQFLRGLFHAHNGKNIPIFTDSPRDWLARLKSYPGDERDVNKAMWDQTFPTEFVEKQLFKDKTLSKDSRRRLFVGLGRASIRFDMEGPLVANAGRLNYLGDSEFVAPQSGFPIHPKNLELAEKNYRGVGEMLVPAKEMRFVKEVEAMLSQPQLNAHLARWAVEVRQKQLAESKSRIIPGSLRSRHHERDRDENIQYRRKIRQ